MAADPTTASKGTKHVEPTSVVVLEGVDVPAMGAPESCVVRDVNWRVNAGERWVLAGRSGTGKSSLLYLLAGLARPVRGRYLMFGAELDDLSERERLEQRVRIGLVFGGGGRLFPHLSAAENIALPLFYHARERSAERLERVAELLEALELEPFARRLPRDLPRRIAQRVGLARALALEPEALLLDDPGSGLGEDEVGWWRGFVDRCGTDSLVASRSVRTLVIAVPDTAVWTAKTDGLAEVGTEGWHVSKLAEARPEMLHPVTAG